MRPSQWAEARRRRRSRLYFRRAHVASTLLRYWRTRKPRTEVNQRWEEPMPEAKPYQIPKRLAAPATRYILLSLGREDETAQATSTCPPNRGKSTASVCQRQVPGPPREPRRPLDFGIRRERCCRGRGRRCVAGPLPAPFLSGLLPPSLHLIGTTPGARGSRSAKPPSAARATLRPGHPGVGRLVERGG